MVKLSVHSIWNGSISFGLVNIPVKMFAATEDKSIKFHFLHRDCHTPVTYQKFCPHCGVEVKQEELVRGYEYKKGRYVVVEEEELARLPTAAAKMIEITNFVSSEEIDPIYFQKTYYLAPGDTGIKAYHLLFEALMRTGKVGIARVTIRNKQYLAALRVYQQVLVMETMFYPDEVRSPAALPDVDRKVDLSSREIEMAIQLVENLTEKFQPEQYQDEYRKELLQLIESKVTGQEIALPPPRREEKVVDLVEALKASIEATGKHRKTGRKKKKAGV
jgi:DNA end-binding protein Ku